MADRPGAGPASFLAPFGFDLPLEDWLERIRGVEGGGELGSLGAYELLGLVGQGGQGVVYRARQKGTGREVALKRLLGGSFATPDSRRRFAREIESAARLHHPGIVAVYGYDEVDGHPLLVMEWIDGVPVTAWARGDAGPVPETHEVLEVAIAMCEAVQHAHQNGVLHRDLKPSNVLVDADGRPRVVDFGLAKRMDGEASEATGSGAFLGTPEYASPEQFGRGAPVDARSDVYSLGVILYEMLTGVRPYGGPVPLREHLDALAAESVRRPSQVRRGLNAEIDAILLQCLAYRPEDRYRTVDGLASDLARYLRGDAVLAHPPSTWYQLVKIARRNPSAASLAGALLLLLAAAAGVFSWQARVLAAERDAALDAREAERHANAALLATQRDLDEQRERALEEAQRTEAVATYFAQDLIDQLHVLELGPDATFLETIDATQGSLGERFAGRPDLEAAVRGSIGSIYQHVGRLADALEQVERVLEIAAAHDPPDPLALAGAKYLVGQTRLAIGDDVPGALRLLEESVAEALALEPVASSVVGGSSVYLARHHDDRRDFERVEEICRVALEAHRAGDTEGHWTRYLLESWLAEVLVRRGELDEARARLDAAWAHAEQHGQSDLAVDLLSEQGRLALEVGDAEAATAAYRAALAFYQERLGAEHEALVHPLSGLVSALQAAGRPDDALDAAQRLVALARLHSESLTAAALTSLGSIHLAREEAEQGYARLADARALEDGLARGGRHNARNLRLLATACDRLGRRDEARAYARRGLAETEALLGAEHTDAEALRALLGRLAAER